MSSPCRSASFSGGRAEDISYTQWERGSRCIAGKSFVLTAKAAPAPRGAAFPHRRDPCMGTGRTSRQIVEAVRRYRAACEA